MGEGMNAEERQEFKELKNDVKDLVKGFNDLQISITKDLTEIKTEWRLNGTKQATKDNTDRIEIIEQNVKDIQDKKDYRLKMSSLIVQLLVGSIPVIILLITFWLTGKL